MAIGDVLNIQARTLDTQAVYQQAISQSELALRQAEKNLASERLRRERQVAAGEGSESAGAAGAQPRQAAQPESSKLRRYRVAFQAGRGPGLEMEDNLREPGNGRLDLKA
jgi:hypothetical protein